MLIVVSEKQLGTLLIQKIKSFDIVNHLQLAQQQDSLVNQLIQIRHI
jgi:hypothetical protein